MRTNINPPLSPLKVTGLGTALKILFSGEFDRPGLALPAATGDLKLSRNEIVALFNSFGKLSTSIVELERFREMLRFKFKSRLPFSANCG